jgi:hypothetical protein
VTEQDINDLLKVFDSRYHCYPLNVVDAIRFLVKQRDEARREVCELRADLRSTRTSPEEIAEDRGWNCFDEKQEADDNNKQWRETNGKY